MRHPHIKLLLLLSCLFFSTTPANPQDQPSKAQPFTLTWTEGKCKHCETARQLAEIDFTTGEAWAVGFLWPYHGQGSGDYIMVHSADGGRTWKELRFSAMHGGGPTFALLDARRAWVSAMAPAGECAVRQTSDGGRHWKTLTDECIELVRFFSAQQGYGLRLCQDAEQSCFARTSDGGRTWGYSALPAIRYVDKAFFLDTQTGWIAGKTQDKRVVTLRTSDGGQHWDVSIIQAGNDLAEVRDLFFLDPRRGWLITWAFNEGGTRLLKTVDGGKSWIGDPDNSFQGQNKWLSVVRFLNDKVGFAFNSVYTSNDPPEPIEGAEGYLRLHFGGGDENNLLYTHDGGAHWDSFAIPRQIHECQVSKGDLLCSAISGESGLWLVKVHPLGH